MASNTIARKEIAEKVAEKVGLSKTKADEVVSIFIEEIQEQLRLGQVVNLPGFAKFTPALRPERKGKNPATGNEIVIPEKKVVKVKVSKTTEDILNK